MLLILAWSALAIAALSTAVLVLNRRTDTALAVADAFHPDVRDSVPSRIARFLARALAGEERYQHVAQSEGIEQLATAGDVFPRMIAEGYALAGRPNHAVRWLAVAVDRGFINLPFMALHDPCLANVRSVPEFQQLMEIVRDRWTRFVA